MTDLSGPYQLPVDWHHVDASSDASSLFVLEATGDSGADRDTIIAVQYKRYYMDVVAADDAESSTGDSSETIFAHDFEVGADDNDKETCNDDGRWAYGEMDGWRPIEMGQEEEEEEEGVVDSWRRVQVREMKEMEDRLFWERCLAMGFP